MNGQREIETRNLISHLDRIERAIPRMSDQMARDMAAYARAFDERPRRVSSLNHVNFVAAERMALASMGRRVSLRVS